MAKPLTDNAVNVVIPIGKRLCNRKINAEERTPSPSHVLSCPVRMSEIHVNEKNCISFLVTKFAKLKSNTHQRPPRSINNSDYEHNHLAQRLPNQPS